MIGNEVRDVPYYRTSKGRKKVWVFVLKGLWRIPKGYKAMRKERERERKREEERRRQIHTKKDRKRETETPIDTERDIQRQRQRMFLH